MLTCSHRSITRATISACLGGLLAAPVSAGVFEDGDLVITESSRILRLNITSGERSIISSDTVGDGPDLRRALCLDFEPTADPLSPNLLVAEFDGYRITRIDPATGDRETVSSDTVGTGPAFRPSCLSRASDGTIYATSGDEILAVDPTNGNRTVLSSATVGSGPIPSQFDGIQYIDEEQIYVADAGSDAILWIDPATGDRTVVASDTEGAGPSFDVPRAFAASPIGELLVADTGLDAVFKMNPFLGDRSILSGGGIGIGAPIDFPHGIAVDYDGDVIVANFFESTIIRIHPETLDRSTVTSASVGSGPAVSNPRDVDVVRIGRRLFGFEFEATGDFPNSPALQSIGNPTVESLPSFFETGDAIDAPEGNQVFYITTGPGDQGGGSGESDSTGNGFPEYDPTVVLFPITRLPSDPATFVLEYDILTGEPNGSTYNDVVEIEIDGLPLLRKAVQGPNGTWDVQDQFDGSSRSGSDDTTYTQGRAGFRSLAINLDYGTHYIRMGVLDDRDRHGDTALLVDDMRFVPEPASSLLLTGGVLGLLGLGRSRRP